MRRRLWRRLRAGVRMVRPLGWILLVLGLAGLVGTALTGWAELAVLATACLLLLALTFPFLFGRTTVEVELQLEPLRVIAGDSVAGDIKVTNIASGRLLPTILLLPVGAAQHRYGVPLLAPGASHEESFTLRTERRGVIPVGPARTRRGDPLGVFSRDLSWTRVEEILVRPQMLPLSSLGAGLLRDLEGVSIDAVSQSDLAFHALREYVPGDELRHVHWRSSAKAMGVAGQTQLLVREYLDTRRSHAAVVVDDLADSWADPEDFETAMSVAASLAVRAILDDFETSFMCGDQAASGTDGHLALDAICRAGLGRTGLVESARQAQAIAPDTSLLFLVTGAPAGFEGIARAAVAYGPEVRRIALIIDPSSPSRATEADGMSVLHMSRKPDLPALLRWSVR
jgi:Protein of unknown function DUF58